MSYPLRYNKAQQGWDYKLVDAFNGGINKALRQETIADGELLTANNVSIRQAKIRSDTGYVKFGGAVRGVPQTTYQYFKRSGASELLLVTTSTLYKYAEGAGQWQFVRGAAQTNLTAQANAGATSIQVASISGFLNGDYIGIALNDGTQHQTQISAAPAGTTIPLANAIPVGKSAPNTSVVVKALLLNGDLDSQISIVAVPAEDGIAFTNGVDLPIIYDGVSAIPIPNLPVGFTACKVVAEYNAALFLMYTHEGGLDFPQRIRRSDIGDVTNWTTNLAGYDDLLDGADFILAAEIMGPYIIVYRERSIVRGQFVNTGGKIYQWDTTVDGEGVVSTQAVVNLNAQHLIFANAGIYSYTGGYDLESVGDKIFYQIFSDEGDLNVSRKNRIFSFYAEELDEAWFFYPSGSSDYPDTLLRYNVGDETWTRRVFAKSFVGFGFYQTVAARRWVDLVGSWASQAWKWNSRTVSGGSPATQLCSPTDFQVYQYDYVTTSDNGVAIPQVVETKDFMNTSFSIRFDQLDLYIKGQNILVEISPDSGDTYITLGTVTQIKKTVVHLEQQVIADRVRFRLSTSSPGFELGWLGFSYRLESSYRNVAGS